MKFLNLLIKFNKKENTKKIFKVKFTHLILIHSGLFSFFLAATMNSAKDFSEKKSNYKTKSSTENKSNYKTVNSAKKKSTTKHQEPSCSSTDLFCNFRESYFQYKKEPTCLGATDLWCKYQELINAESPYPKKTLDEILEKLIQIQIEKKLAAGLLKEKNSIARQGEKVWANQEFSNLSLKDNYLTKLKVNYQDSKELCARKIKDENKCKKIVLEGNGESLKIRIEKSWEKIAENSPAQASKVYNNLSRTSDQEESIFEKIDKDFKKLNEKLSKIDLSKFLLDDSDVNSLIENNINLLTKIYELSDIEKLSEKTNGTQKNIQQVIKEDLSEAQLIKEEMKEKFTKLKVDLDLFFNTLTEEQKLIVNKYIKNSLFILKSKFEKIYKKSAKLRDEDKNKKINLLINLFKEISAPGFWIENLYGFIPNVDVKFTSFEDLLKILNLPKEIKERIRSKGLSLKNLFKYITKEEFENILKPEILDNIKILYKESNENIKKEKEDFTKIFTKNFFVRLLKFMPKNWLNMISDWVDKIPKSFFEKLLKELSTEKINDLKEIRDIPGMALEYLTDNFIILLNILKKLPIK